MTRLGIVTGLAREARCFDGLTGDSAPLVRCDGMGPASATRAARGLLFDGCETLVSFGIAGGLDPALTAGTVVVADGVETDAGERLPTDSAWRSRLLECLEGQVVTATGVMLGSGHVVAEAAAKRRLFEETGAVAVDMESHAVGEVAAANGVPFLVVRAISDPAANAIPPSAMAGAGTEGMTRHLRVTAALVKRPQDLPGLLRLKRDVAAALGTLRRVVSLAGPGLGLA